MGTTQHQAHFENKLVQRDSLSLFGADDDTESIYPESIASEDETLDPTVKEDLGAGRTEEIEDEEPAKELCVWVKKEVAATVTTSDELDKEDHYRRRGGFKWGYKKVPEEEHCNDRGDETEAETETETETETNIGNEFVQGYESSQESEFAYTSSDDESEGCLGIPDCLVCSSVVLYQQERESSSEEDLTL